MRLKFLQGLVTGPQQQRHSFVSQANSWGTSGPVPLGSQHLYHFLPAAVTNYCRLAGLRLTSGGQKSEVSFTGLSYRITGSRGHGVTGSQGGLLVGALGEDLFSCLFELQEASCLPWLMAPSLFHSNPLFSSSRLLLLFCQKIVAVCPPGEGYGLEGGKGPVPSFSRVSRAM